MRDGKVLESFKKKIEKEKKEKNIFKHLRKEVETGANGTQDYIIKKGINKGKVAKWKEKYLYFLTSYLWLGYLVCYLWFKVI